MVYHKQLHQYQIIQHLSLKCITPETPEGETSFVAIQQTLEPLGENKYKMKFTSVETRDMSGLTIRKDKTIPILVCRWYYLYDRCRNWFLLESSTSMDCKEPDGRTLRLAAHTNKNWFSMKKDLDAVTEFAHLPPYTDQLVDVDRRKEKEEERKGR